MKYCGSARYEAALVTLKKTRRVSYALRACVTGVHALPQMLCALSVNMTTLLTSRASQIRDVGTRLIQCVTILFSFGPISSTRSRYLDTSPHSEHICRSGRGTGNCGRDYPTIPNQDRTQIIGRLNALYTKCQLLFEFAHSVLPPDAPILSSVDTCQWSHPSLTTSPSHSLSP